MGVESTTENQDTEELASLQNTLDSEQIAFVDTVAEEIATVIDDASRPHRYEYIVGEVSDYGISSNDHAYFDLVGEECQLRCVIFQYRRQSIDIDIEDGIQVAVKGGVSFYSPHNYCSITVEHAVVVGEGAYQQTYEQNKQLLDEDGLLDAATHQSLPDYPRCVGLVTSAESDAREDAVTSIHNRHPGVDIMIQDTTVQGDEAKQSMIQAIGRLDEEPRVDVIVLTRGGGSDTHLRVFNKTALCRVIHRISTPIAVGVGHEADQTLAEEVADRRVMTPTEVGTVVPSDSTLTEQLTRQHDRLDTAYAQTVTDRLTDRHQRLDQAYEQHVSGDLTDLATTLDHAYETLEQQKQHEREQAEAARARRRQRLLLAALAMLVLLLLGFILL